MVSLSPDSHRFLRRFPELCDLTPRQLQVIIHLWNARGEFVTTRELREAIWGTTYSTVATTTLERLALRLPPGWQLQRTIGHVRLVTPMSQAIMRTAYYDLSSEAGDCEFCLRGDVPTYTLMLVTTRFRLCKTDWVRVETFVRSVANLIAATGNRGIALRFDRAS